MKEMLKVDWKDSAKKNNNNFLKEFSKLAFLKRNIHKFFMLFHGKYLVQIIVYKKHVFCLD